MTDESPPPSTRDSLNIVDRMLFGDGFQNEQGALRVKEDADPEECKKALAQLCRHLTVGQVEAQDVDFDVSAIFEAIPQESR